MSPESVTDTLLLLLHVETELSLGGSSPYNRYTQRNKNKYTKHKTCRGTYRQMTKLSGDFSTYGKVSTKTAGEDS